MSGEAGDRTAADTRQLTIHPEDDSRLWKSSTRPSTRSAACSVVLAGAAMGFGILIGSLIWANQGDVSAPTKSSLPPPSPQPPRPPPAPLAPPNMGRPYCTGGGNECWRNRIVYQILTDRFARNNGSTAPCENLHDYCGGGWKGMLAKIDYIDALGVDAIWISPV
eukprot:3695359-Prymnesium_polylepis.1